MSEHHNFDFFYVNPPSLPLPTHTAYTNVKFAPVPGSKKNKLTMDASGVQLDELSVYPDQYAAPEKMHYPDAYATGISGRLHGGHLSELDAEGERHAGATMAHYGFEDEAREYPSNRWSRTGGGGPTRSVEYENSALKEEDKAPGPTMPSASENRQLTGFEALEQQAHVPLAWAMFELEELGPRFRDLAELLRNNCHHSLSGDIRDMLIERCEPAMALMAELQRRHHPRSSGLRNGTNPMRLIIQ
ncbi:hypothetical protein C8R45DRAFT_980426 [Mycena sanguinolenta]|nr:hypothetical protein C8R45DRAFT_980426 [Mycena sanguinolenta]